MELKHTNPNSGIVLESIFNLVELLYMKIVKIEFKNEYNTLFPREISIIDHKTRISINFTLLMQLE